MKTFRFLIVCFFAILLASVGTLVAQVVPSQADSAFVNSLSSVGIPASVVWTVLGVVGWVLGHFVIKAKWTSVTLWAEKIVYTIYAGLHWFNEKTNAVKKS